nr:MAG TPA: toxin [Caudoviricetes sp.]
MSKPEEAQMKVDALTLKTEEEISALIAKKISELRKKTGKEVSEIQFVAREAMTGLEGYDVKIKLL